MTGAVAAPLPAIGDALRAAIDRLAVAGVAEARADAEILVAAALGTTRAAVVARARQPLPAGAAAALEALVARRAAREPVQYVVGEWEFWSLPLAVDARVLIPRPETELLVETARTVGAAARRVVDVGTGSGAVAAALARELPAARVVATDLDGAPLTVARANLDRHAPRVRLVRGDLLEGVRSASVELVVSNPPYVADDDIPGLAPEVRDHEPRRALAGGRDGLDVLRRLVVDAARVLVPGGWLVVEMGAGQAAQVRALVSADDRYVGARTVCDPAGIARVLVAQRRDGERRGTWIPS